jgi:hypothetical protein
LDYPIQGEDVLNHFAFGTKVTNFYIRQGDLYDIPHTSSRINGVERIQIGQKRFKSISNADADLKQIGFLSPDVWGKNRSGAIYTSIRALTNWLIKVGCGKDTLTIGNLKIPESITIGRFYLGESTFTTQCGYINLSEFILNMLDCLAGPVSNKWDFIHGELLNLMETFTLRNIDMGKFHLYGVGLLHKIVACNKTSYLLQELSGDSQIHIDLSIGAGAIIDYSSSNGFVKIYSADPSISGLEFKESKSCEMRTSVKYIPGNDSSVGKLEFNKETCSYILDNSRSMTDTELAFEANAEENYKKSYRTRIVDCLMKELELGFNEDPRATTALDLDVEYSSQNA